MTAEPLKSEPLPSPSEIVSFWREAGPQKWYVRDDDLDAAIRARFLPAHEAAARGELWAWEETAEGALALLLLLDQFPRNLFRGSAHAFATDAPAFTVADRAIVRGLDAQVNGPMRQFFYLPLMHAEEAGAQRRCVAAFESSARALRKTSSSRACIWTSSNGLGVFPTATPCSDASPRHRSRHFSTAAALPAEPRHDSAASAGAMMPTPSDPLPGLGAWADETDPPPPPPAPRAGDLDAALATLEQRFGNRYTANETIRRQHAHTLTWTRNEPPDAVVFPQSTEEVADIVRTCATHRVPVIPFGTGTSLEGHVNAPLGGVSLDTSMMKRIIAVHQEDLDCVVEAGVTRKELNDHLRHSGLFFPIDPGADASIGGMASTRASGTNAVRYGTMKDNVLALTIVTASGEIMRTGSRARKSSAGYDLTRLFVGAEGTLGVITEVTLRLHGLPEFIVGGICPFPSVKAACDAPILTIQSGVPVARIELLDALAVRSVNLHSRLGLPETPMLLVEFHGTQAGAQEQAERFGAIAADLGGGPFSFAAKPEERTKLWQARHDAYWAGFTLRPGAKGLATDICVPISRLADCVTQTQDDMAASNLTGPIIGHVGDGNFHVNLLFDVDDADEVSRVEGFLERLVARGLDMGGTCTGEHGIGQAKMKYMAMEHDAPALAAMRALKAALDPQGIMNPGKLAG